MVDEDLEARVAQLERASERLGQTALRLDTRLLHLEAARRPPVPVPSRDTSWSPVAAPSYPPPPPQPPARPPRSPVTLADLLGRRVLGWLGGAAILIGIGLFLALAISRGWIGPEGRVILAGATSVVLMTVGVWLYERHGRTEAAAIAVAVAIAGQWATLVVAVDLYRLLAPLAGVGLALATATAAALLALRWAGRPIAALGLVGGLLSPLALGVADHTAAIAILALAAAVVIAVTAWQGWRWIAVAALAACAPQWALWLNHAPSLALQLAVVAWFTGLGLTATVLSARGREGIDAATGALAVLTAALSGLVGLGLWALDSQDLAGAWTAAVALAFAACGSQRTGGSRLFASMMIATAVALADAALALVLSGLWLTAAWGVSALACAWLVRRGVSPELARAGLGAQIGLVLLRALQASIGAGHGDLVAILSLSVLAGACLAGGVATGRRARPFTVALHGLGLLATAYLTAETLSGVALVAAWCGQAAVLAEVSRRGADRLAGAAALGILGLAVAHVLVVEAPPTGLVIGVPDVVAAALALAAIAAVLLRAGLASHAPRERATLLAGVAGAALYLGSVALITAFQPAAGTVDDTVLDLGVRQQGQVLLSAAWSMIGVAVLVAGLRTNRATLRTVGLGVLLVAVGKVFLYDLSTLTSIYRVLSLVGIGALCLGGAFAYQRLRPAPLPDLRMTAPVHR